MKDNEQVRVGANGTLFIADVGAPLPADIDDAIDAAYADLGYLSEDGVNFSDGKTTFDIGAWQSFYPIRTGVEGRETTAAFVMRQWSRDTVSLAFGGGEFLATTNGTRYNPPDPEDVDERAAIIEWHDGDYTYRVVIPRCVSRESVETNFVRTGPADLPITLGVVGQSGVQPWYLLTNDPALQSGS